MIEISGLLVFAIRFNSENKRASAAQNKLSQSEESTHVKERDKSEREQRGLSGPSISNVHVGDADYISRVETKPVGSGNAE
jgi:hypothetical protein